MKRTKKEFNEALGVPNNIVNVARDAWNNFKQEFERELYQGETEYEFTLRPSEPYQIADMPVKEINYKVELHPTSQVDEPEFIGFAVRGKMSRELEGKRPIFLSVDKEGKTNMSVEIAVPEIWDEEEVMDFLNRNNVMSVSSFSHELKHEYDEFKRPHTSPEKRISYNSAKEMMATFPPLREFAFYLYFTHEIESLVRPTEVAAALDMMGITREQFKDFLFNNKTYEQLRKISEFSVEKMKNDLLDYVGEIRQMLEDVDDEYSDDMTDEEVVKRVLELTYITMVNKKGSDYLSMIVENPLEAFFGLPTRKSEWMDQYIKKISKYRNNPLKYFDVAEVDLQMTAKKMMRKLAKLYDLAKINPSD